MTVGGPLIGIPGGIWPAGGCAVRDQPPCVIAPVSGLACGWPTAGASGSEPAPGTPPACGLSAPRSSARNGPAVPGLAGGRGTAGGRPGGGAVQLDGTDGGVLARGRAGSNGPRMASSASGASSAGDGSSAGGSAPAAGTGPAGGGAGQAEGLRTGSPAGGVVACGAWLAGGSAG
jgi:hypothetical protein